MEFFTFKQSKHIRYFAVSFKSILLGSIVQQEKGCKKQHALNLYQLSTIKMPSLVFACKTKQLATFYVFLRQ